MSSGHALAEVPPALPLISTLPCSKPGVCLRVDKSRSLPGTQHRAFIILTVIQGFESKTDSFPSRSSASHLFKQTHRKSNISTQGCVKDLFLVLRETREEAAGQHRVGRPGRKQ